MSVEPRSLLVTRHDPSTFPKIGIKNATLHVPIFGSTAREADENLKKGRKFILKFATASKIESLFTLTDLFTSYHHNKFCTSIHLSLSILLLS